MFQVTQFSTTNIRKKEFGNNEICWYRHDKLGLF